MKLPDFKIPPRAIAIDLDGTLLNNRTELSESNRRALERCIDAGIPVIIATSRPARIFDRIFPRDLAQKCSYVLMNGALAKGNPPLSGTYQQALGTELTEDIVTCALRLDPSVRITIEIDGYEFGTNWYGTVDPETLWRRNSATPDMLLTLQEAITRNPCKVALGNTDIFTLAERVEHEFGSSLSIVGAKFTNVLSTPILNITHKNATKPAAIQNLLEPHAVSLSDVLAFGDDLPDLDMLRACGTAVAMANAFPEVKAICAYETASNDEDGVALVLERMLGNRSNSL